jgi:imidazolonepropionase-like amidohydrolase
MRHTRTHTGCLPLALSPVALLAMTLATDRSEAQSANAAPLAIVGGTLIDGTGNPPRTDVTIHIEQGRIKSITSSATAPRSDEQIIDAHGRFVLPGLIDANSHATLYGQPQRSDTLLKYGDRGEDLAIEFTQKTLKYGVTTIRDSYGILPVDIAARNAIERGDRIGSRLLAAGNIIGWGGTYSLTFSMTRADAVPRQRGLELTPFQAYWNDLITQGTGENLTDMTPDQLRLAIDHYLDKGPDFIKYGGTAHFLRPTLIGFSLEQQKAIVEEAHKRGRKVDVHATSPEGLRLSVEAGIDLIQHADILSQDYPDDLVRLIQKRKPICSIMSNLSTGRLWSEYQAQRSAADEKYSKMPAPATTAERNTRRESVGLYGDAIEYQRRNTVRLMKAGCRITVGTDAAIFDAPEFRTAPPLVESSPGIATQRAIEGLVELGMSPMQALVAATGNGGIATNIPDLGTIEPGKLADVLILSADPLQDIHNIEKIFAVIARGRPVDPDRLPERPVFKE